MYIKNLAKRFIYTNDAGQLCEMFLAQMESGHITPVKAMKRKGYIEESNDGVTS